MKANQVSTWALVALTALTSCSPSRDLKKTAEEVGPAPVSGTNKDHEPAKDAPLAAAPTAPVVLRNAVPITGLPTYGPSDALVTLVEVTDYDCPFCAKSQATLHTLRERHGKDLRVAVVESPLPMHARAEPAALAALAADAAGRFEVMHTRLFEAKGKRTDDDLLALAVESGVPRRTFESLVTSRGPREALANARSLASGLRVRGTPAFFVNGRKIAGAQPIGVFEALIEEELVHARALVMAGLPRASVYDAILEEARKNPAPLDEDEAIEPSRLEPAARDVGGARFLGVTSAPVTVVLFTDLECPFCARLDTELRELVEKHKDVRVVLRHAPLPMHAHATLAARAALAAEAQNKLAAYTALVFSDQHDLERATLIAHARTARLDVVRFTRDLDSAWVTARLEADQALAKKLDVRGTPTAFVDSERVVGAQPLATFEHAIDDAKRR